MERELIYLFNFICNAKASHHCLDEKSHLEGVGPGALIHAGQTHALQPMLRPMICLLPEGRKYTASMKCPHTHTPRVHTTPPTHTPHNPPHTHPTQPPTLHNPPTLHTTPPPHTHTHAQAACKIENPPDCRVVNYKLKMV